MVLLFFDLFFMPALTRYRHGVPLDAYLDILFFDTWKIGINMIGKLALVCVNDKAY